jgi:hypothetical protein
MRTVPGRDIDDRPHHVLRIRGALADAAERRAASIRRPRCA